jgi:glutamate synthase (NADPH) large chain
MGAGSEAETLRTLIERHVAATGSAHARGLLDDWETALGSFWRVIPRAAVAIRAEAEAAAAEVEQARGVAD